jgi:ATP-dependent Clp protease ATP-binding subunit ClpA
VGYVGSEAGTQLSNFMGDHSGKPSVVLLDEFDHCDPETWEAFYHIFDEGPIRFVVLRGVSWHGVVLCNVFRSAVV